MVLLCGEPGIGKSRILSALRERLEGQGAGTLRFQCSPYTINSALYPFIDHFERVLKFARDEAPGSKLDKLEALIVAHYGRPLGDVRFIASVLSIPCDERYGALPMTPQKHKDETLRALADVVEAAAARAPTAMLFEDAHWAALYRENQGGETRHRDHGQLGQRHDASGQGCGRVGIEGFVLHLFRLAVRGRQRDGRRRHGQSGGGVALASQLAH